jgi:nucleoid DNA-binding protein
MLSKSQVASEISAETGIGKNLVVRVLNELALIAEDEIAAGEDFTVPGIARISYRYRKPQKKGERWKKGQEVTGFGGIVSTKDEDSPPVTPLVRLVAAPTGAVAKLKPKRDPDVQKAFLKTAPGKRIVKRKS